MIRPICRDCMILSRKSTLATKDDLPVMLDLLDTLEANAECCVGMAANMIGINKRIIVFSAGILHIPMINPAITARSGAYEAEEGCLSLDGVRKTTRFQSITVEYLDRGFKKQRQSFSGWTAQIIQHEIDHCDGILI